MSDTSPEIHVNEELLERAFGPIENTQAGAHLPSKNQLLSLENRYSMREHEAQMHDRIDEPDIYIFSGGGIND